MDERKQFLIEMYNQLCSEIDRHIQIIWQIVGVLLSTLAVFALVEKDIITLDVATGIIGAVCFLSIAIIIESNYWYNRNLVIIANIERQFLLPSDSRDISYYFVKHRKNNAYLDMMLIQIIFVFSILFILLIYHFSKRVIPNLSFSNDFAIEKTIPYIVSIIGLLLLWVFHRKRVNNYNDFKSNSPGIVVPGVPNIASNSDHVT